MKLTSPQPYWLLHNGLGEAEPLAPPPRRADVVVIGAGISGALLAERLTRGGLRVVMLESRHQAQGSTAASTALLQYEIDAHLSDLIDELGQKRAVEAYRGCLAGLSALSGLARELGDVGFRSRPSLYLASDARDAQRLRKEGRVRRRFGLPCDTWGRRELDRQFESAPQATALWTRRAAEVDPYRFCRALLARCHERDFVLAERTTALGLVPQTHHIEVHTDRGVLRAKHVVVAAGYESARFLPGPVARLHSTFALVTEPLAEFKGWPERCLIWESARPYLYLRTTTDGRVLVGGRDVRFQNAEKRDGRINTVAAQLLREARRLLPQLELEGAYAWAGTFGETQDGLGYIGPHPALDARISFALGYGGNGITYSALAARVLTARIQGRKDRYATTFAFDR